jgi:hypothetical protein
MSPNESRSILTCPSGLLLTMVDMFLFAKLLISLNDWKPLKPNKIKKRKTKTVFNEKVLKLKFHAKKNKHFDFES